jgi:hypothetical protein
MVGDGVGAGVARAQQPRQRLAGGIGKAQHGVEAEAALVGGPGAHLVLGVDLDQRGVDVEHHGTLGERGSRA